MSNLDPLICLCALIVPHQRSFQPMGARSRTVFVIRITPPTTQQNIDHFLQTLRKLLVDPLPKGSALTAIFDSCNSGTLLGNIPSTPLCPLSLTPGKILTIIGATMCIGHGSTGESEGAKSFKTASVRRHRTSMTAYHLTPLQLGGTPESLVLRPRADPTPHFGRAAAR